MEKLFSEALNCVTNAPGIYYLKVNELNYVGSSVNVKGRLLAHRNDLLKGEHNNIRLLRTYNKYGKEKVWFSVLQTFETYDPDELLYAEKFYIDLLGPVLNLKLDPVTQNNCVTQSKRVYQFNKKGHMVGSYASTKEAERITGIRSSSIVRHIGGHLQSAGGYLWSYEKRAAAIYDLQRSKWKWKAVQIEDTYTGEIKCYDNIAKAARDLEVDDKKFDSVCATISSLCKGRGKLLKQRYKCSYIGSGCKTL